MIGFAVCSVEDILMLRCSKEVRRQRKSQKDNEQLYLHPILFQLPARASVSQSHCRGVDSGEERKSCCSPTHREELGPLMWVGWGFRGGVGQVEEELSSLSLAPGL